MEPFVTGENNNYLARPVDVLVLKDGSLLVSDDYNGAVYRVSYGSRAAVPLLPRERRPGILRPRPR
jgi:hypothetical protein